MPDDRARDRAQSIVGYRACQKQFEEAGLLRNRRTRRFGRRHWRQRHRCRVAARSAARCTRCIRAAGLSAAAPVRAMRDRGCARCYRPYRRMRNVLEVLVDRAVARLVRLVYEHAAGNGRAGLRERCRHDGHRGDGRRGTECDEARKRTGISGDRMGCHATFPPMRIGTAIARPPTTPARKNWPTPKSAGRAEVTQHLGGDKVKPV